MEDQSLPEGCDALKSFVMEQIEKQNVRFSFDHVIELFQI